ncbi:NfeD family protein [Chryseobacterium sp. SNU WT5]|uniref:NfeD family protein n=1 Tax=Chryseobacterium sp. SNU WT5 TaxID=2594269 RepID=UPI001E4DF507|nr:NfeD family protein [Chryseobacterium sp. SNU WT5]
MITEFFSEMPALQKAFWYLSLFASLIFIFQTVMTFLGTDATADLDADFDGDFHDVEAPFELFSFRNLINFLLGFGWTGVAFYGKVNESILVIMSFVVGVIFVGIFFFIIKQILKLQEDNTFNIKTTLGKNAVVYMTIPGHKMGSGKVQISVNGSVHELEAVTEQEKKIYAGNNVKVVKVEDQILFVEKI